MEIEQQSILTAKQIQILKQTAESLREAADNITAIVSNGSQPLLPSHPKLILLLSAVEKAGGIVSKEEYRRIGLKVGYKIHGLAAPFAYPPNNTLTELAGDKIGLTQRGKEKLARHSDWLATQ